MRFFDPPFLATGDGKRMFVRHLTPQECDRKGLGWCSYNDAHGHAHNHVIRFTHERSVMNHLEIQLVDVHTILTQNFTTKRVDYDDS